MSTEFLISLLQTLACLTGSVIVLYTFWFKKWHAAKLKQRHQLLAISKTLGASNSGLSVRLSSLFGSMAVGDFRSAQSIIERVADENFQSAAENVLADSDQLRRLQQLEIAESAARRQELGLDWTEEQRLLAAEESRRQEAITTARNSSRQARIREHLSVNTVRYMQEGPAEVAVQQNLVCNGCQDPVNRTVFGLCRRCLAASPHANFFGLASLDEFFNGARNQIPEVTGSANKPAPPAPRKLSPNHKPIPLEPEPRRLIIE
jgi:rRNA maturation endonuclease Nob1